SSITAAPKIRRASRLWSTWRSLSTRAVIPTEVAVRVAPTKMAVVTGSAAVCSYPCQPERQYRKPRPNGTATPTTATAIAAAPPRTRGRPAARAHRGGLKGLRRLGMEVEGVVEQREGDGLAVFGLDHDLARRRPSYDADLLGLGRETDILRGGLDPAADCAVV